MQRADGPEISFRWRHLGLAWLLGMAGRILIAAAPLPSPLDLHQEVRSLLVDRKDPRALVEQWQKAAGDHSFDSYLAPSDRLREALLLQARAVDLWEASEHREALRLYQSAQRVLEKESSWSEVAFCLYYQGEILSEQERWAESLPLIEHGLRAAGRNALPRPYLEGLLHQSKGYALWFLDQLPASVEAFGRTQQAWETIGFGPGITTSWNNLAVLYEELRLDPQAERSYRKALASLELATPPEIQLQLHTNRALFLHQAGDESGAQAQMKKAAEFGDAGSLEMLLLRARLQPWPGWRRQIEAAAVHSHSQRIDRALLLAGKATDSAQARHWYQIAWRSSQKAGQHAQRKVALAFGEWLELQGGLGEALSLYRAALARKRVSGVAFPYSRALSPLLDGEVRILVRQGRHREARRRIHAQAADRLRRAARVRWSSKPSSAITDLDPLTEAARLERESLSEAPVDRVPGRPVAATAGYSVLEMWPEGNQVFLWIDSHGGSRFSQFALQRPVTQVVADLVGEFYRAGDRLPRPPSKRVQMELGVPLLQVLSKQPLESSLLIVAHKELQPLPLEMLRDGAGRSLDSHFRFSYLPSLKAGGFVGKRDDSPPILVVPDSIDPTTNSEADALGRRFPRLITLKGLALPDPVQSRWMHISSHFRLEPDFWPASRFWAGGETLDLGVFLQRKFALRLLSIGACDVANAYTMHSPYWFGLAELILARRVESILVSRWKLDELSARIYVDFFDRASAGVPMDQALNLARRDFQDSTLTRGKNRVTGEHPFFWAGITYIGRPGSTLYDAGESDRGTALVVLIIVLLIVAYSLVRLIISSRRRRH